MTEPISAEQDRREAQIEAIRNHLAGWPPTGSIGFDNGTNDAIVALNGLLAYFDEQEPALADAIRFGLKEVGVQWICTSTCWQGNGPDGGHTDGCYPKSPDYRIDYPEPGES